MTLPANRLEEIQERLREDFRSEGRELLGNIARRLVVLEHASPEEIREQLQGVSRDLHTLKGASGAVGYSDMRELVHELEDCQAVLEGAARTPCWTCSIAPWTCSIGAWRVRRSTWRD